VIGFLFKIRGPVCGLGTLWL